MRFSNCAVCIHSVQFTVTSCTCADTDECHYHVICLKRALRFPWTKPPAGWSLRASWMRWFGGFQIISGRWTSCSAAVTQTEVDQSTWRISSRVIHLLSAPSSPESDRAVGNVSPCPFLLLFQKQLWYFLRLRFHSLRSVGLRLKTLWTPFSPAPVNVR